MAQSTTRKIKRGVMEVVWNNTFQKIDFFRRTKRGTYILCNMQGSYLASGPGMSAKKMKAELKRQEN